MSAGLRPLRTEEVDLICTVHVRAHVYPDGAQDHAISDLAETLDFHLSPGHFLSGTSNAWYEVTKIKKPRKRR